MPKSQTLTDLSVEPETILAPSFENLADMTYPVWPSTLNIVPFLASHTLTDPSSAVETILLPSLENATDLI